MADNLQIIISAKDDASRPIQNVGSALGNVGQIAAGVFGGALLTKGFDMLIGGAEKVVGALGSMINSAMDAQDTESQLDAVLKSTGAGAKRAAEEYAKAATTWVKALPTSKINELNQKMQDNILKRDKMAAGLQVEKQRLIELSAKWGANGLDTIKARANIADTENDIANLNDEIAGLGRQIEQGQVMVRLSDQMGLIPPQAQITKDAILALADSLGKTTRFEDDVIVSAESMLLTFTNIGKDVFPQATETVLDMSQALGQDLKSSSIQLGKALQDPVAGVTALRRVGVMLTDSQQALIEKMVASGDIMGAQKVILQELQVEFGGSAKAAGETFGGQLDRLKNRLGNIGEAIGLAVIPALQNMATQMIVILDSPAVQGAIGRVTEWITNSLVPGLNVVSTKIMAFISVLAEALKTGDWSVVMTAISLAFENGWATVSTTLMAWAGKFWDWLTAPEGGAISWAGTALTAVGNALYNAGANLWGKLSTWASEFWTWLIAPENGAVSWASTALSMVGTALYNAGASLWATISGWATSFWGWLIDPKAGAVSFVGGILTTVGGFLAGVGGNIWAALSSWAVDFWTWLVDPKTGAVANVTSNLKQVGVIIAANWPEISAKLAGWADKFWEWLTGEKGAISKATAEMKKVAQAMKDASESEDVKSILFPAGEFMGETLAGAIIDAFITLFKPPAGSGVTATSNSLINMLASIATSKTVMLLADFLGIMLAAGIVSGVVNGIKARYEPISTFLNEWLAWIGKTLSETVTAKDIQKWWNEVGQGIWDAISGAVKSAIENATDWFDSIIELIKQKLIDSGWGGSPMMYFAPVGEFIAQGIAAGLEQGEQALTASGELVLDKAFKHWISSMMGGLKKGHVYSQLRDQVFDLISDFGTVAGETYGQAVIRIYNQIIANAPAQLVPRLQASFAQLWAEIAPIANQIVDNTMARMKQYMSAAGVFGGLGSTAAGLLQSRELQPLQTELEQLGGYYDSLTESMAKVTAELNAATDPADIERLRTIQAAIANDIATTQFRITADKERQLQIESELVALQKQQEDLSFLQSQASLVQMIADNGLNAREILGGLTLGLNANLSQVIEAMTRAMQMMIARAEDELGVASPSKRFAEIGRNIMAGLSTGVRLATPSAAAQVANSTQHIVNNTYQLTANYAYQDERSVRDDIRMLQMLGAYT